MKIVILDGHTINPGDLSWDVLKQYCDELTVYEKTDPEDILSRIGDCEIVMTSKCGMTREILSQAPNLRYIGETATGYNNIDIEAARELGIAVANIPAYSTDAVAQHAIALMLEISNNVGLHNAGIQAGKWAASEYFCYWDKPICLLAGKSLGIIGYGAIGKRVAEIAGALGMTIHVYSQDKEAAMKSDFLTLHCPLTTENAGFINEDFINGMKPGAVLINTARGGLLNEEDVAQALKDGRLSAAGLDVLTTEPPAADCPLIGLDNCILTPHIAWAPKEMRITVIDVLAKNLAAWLNNETLNRVDL
ncbi:MAG: D-2-hydroxyacid dehydrogenase [Bacillota bacterium]|nr:D-2-hydroxyacid dehydrogenase [Bacillota bacterium]